MSLYSKINRLILLILKRNTTIGEKPIIDIKTKIRCKKGKISIGNNVSLRSRKKGYHAGMPFSTTLFVDRENAKIEIGDNCRINGAYIHAQKQITIGDNCVIAAGVNIIDSNGHVLHSNNRTVGRDEPKEIFIGNNVWIGLNCIILKGTKIGNNSVVAAGSIVKGDFPENSLIQGNPAVLVKTLDIQNKNSEYK